MTNTRRRTILFFLVSKQRNTDMLPLFLIKIRYLHCNVHAHSISSNKGQTLAGEQLTTARRATR
jgi:hypothetical protein